MAFWKASIEDDWDEFNFDRAIAHSLNEIDYYVYSIADEILEEKINPENRENAYWVVIDVRTEEEKTTGAFYAERQAARLGLDLIKAKRGSQLDKIIALDNIIHFEHATGGVFKGVQTEHYFEYLDVPMLRQDFDEAYSGIPIRRLPV